MFIKQICNRDDLLFGWCTVPRYLMQNRGIGHNVWMDAWADWSHFWPHMSNIARRFVFKVLLPVTIQISLCVCCIMMGVLNISSVESTESTEASIDREGSDFKDI